MNPNTRALWDKKYGKYIERKYIRSDGKHLDKFMEFFERSGTILDFGSGLGGNVRYLASRLSDTRFILVDQSSISLEYSRTETLGESDKRKNRFEFLQDLEGVGTGSVDLVMSIEVLEHITDYQQVLERLWDLLKPGGILLISVPVLGFRDRTRVHVNKFTVTRMFRILSAYTGTVHISPRTYSKRSGRLSTAYFHIWKEK